MSIKKLILAVMVVVVGAFAVSTLTSGNKVATETNHVNMGSERVVEVYGPIDFQMAEVIIRQLRELDAANPNKEIIVRIVSPGGGVS